MIGGSHMVDRPQPSTRSSTALLGKGLDSAEVLEQAIAGKSPSPRALNPTIPDGAMAMLCPAPKPAKKAKTKSKRASGR